MKVTSITKKIISHYTHENVGVRSNLMRILGQGKLGGTGRMIILPVDQGFEHGPDRSFAVNPPAYDPNYHHQLAIDAWFICLCSSFGFTSNKL
jgi:class I fructose-bisphosphate aldolase